MNTMVITSLCILLFLELLTRLTFCTQRAELYFLLLRKDGKHSDKSNQPTNGFPLRQRSNRLPAPSDRLPVNDLLETEGQIYDPRDEDIDTEVLMRILGKNYDKEFMSITNPRRRLDKDRPLITWVKGRPKGNRPDFLRLLRTVRLQDGRKLKLNATKKQRRTFQKYMWSLTFCPVKYSWKNLGIRFWPRWIRKGTCINKRSCSIPEGMTCQPSASRNKVLLRWHCGDFERRIGCQWIPIQYPIITECSCSC